MAKLWIHVKGATLDEPASSSVVTVLKLGSTTHTTVKAETPNPVWNEDFLFTVDDVSKPLTVEIHKTSLFSRKLLGLATIPLYNVRHSNKPGNGHWSYLFLPTPSGKLLPTQNQIQLDTHFKLPEDLPEDLAEELEKKLQAMDVVLDKEVEAIQIQQHKLVTGKLAPPTSQHGDFSYPSQSRPTSSTENPSPPYSASVTPDEPDGPMKPYRERVNAIHEGMITPFQSESESDEEIECSEARKKWRSILKNTKFQLLMLEQQRHKDSNTGNGNGSGTTSLAQLVDQLKAFRQMGQIQTEQNVQSLITANTAFLTRSVSAINKRGKTKGRHFIEGNLRMQVYRRTLGALAYPVSESQKHKFEKWTAHTPTVCSECSALLWGITKQGVKCSRCSKICHERCASLATQDCFLRDRHSAISEKMQRTVVNHPKRFNTLREAFNIPESEHKTLLSEIQKHILDLVDNFKAEITIKVIAAQGLNTAKISDRRIFVSVAVGHTKRRTKVFRTSEDDRCLPMWKHEEFTFFSNNYHDIVQIRVWNERDSALARVLQSMTKEGDIFLGEKIIEVRRIGPVGCKNVWYKLDKRTEDTEVSGYLWLNLSSQVEGDEVASASFYDMYMKLHEQMFYHTYFHENQPLKEVGPKPESCDGGLNVVKLFPNVAQEILDEFALRYSIDSIYRMMVHMELLVNHHSLKNALTVMGNLLKNLKYHMILHVATDNSVRAIGASKLMQEYLDASNFGGVEFSQVLDRLMSFLASDLQQYREFYPCNDLEKLAELTETCQLTSIVVEFQQQAMSLPSSAKLEDFILKNTKECLHSTFDFIVQSCIPAGNKGQHPGLSTTGKPFQFFYDLLKHIKSVIYEDRTIYAAAIKKFVSFNLGDVSTEEMWHYFGTTIEGLFDEEDNNELFPPNEYMQLLFAVKVFYESHVAKLPSRAGVFPEYSRWFLPCVRRWLHEYQKKAFSFVENAWEDDKQRLNFARHEKQFYSSSTYQMFFYLHEGLGLVQSLETESGNPDIKFEHLYEFALVIRSVVQHYVDMISMHIPVCIEDLEKACMLLNNLQALRVNVQGLFEEMGGAKLAGPRSSEVLNDFQATVLSKELTSWCSFVGRSLTPSVLQGVTLLQIELLKLKGLSGVDRKDGKAIAGPLLDAIHKSAQVIAASSENLVIQKVIKVLWYVVHESLHRMLLPMLKWEQEGTSSSDNCVQFQTHYYTGRQCTALEIVLEILKDFFTAAESKGIKAVAMDKGMKQLRGVIGLYRQTTEMLITDFIADEIKHVQNKGAMCGEVFLEIDAFLHFNSGELEGTIRVVSASNLKTQSGSSTMGTRGLKPYVELHILTPNTTTHHKRKFVTRYRTTGSPSFNESFKFTLESLENAELQVVVRNHVVIGTDKIIGMAIVPFALVHQEANLSLGLSPFIPISDRGYALLNVLSVRTSDEFAKQFVDLKMNQRVSEHVSVEK